MNPELQPVYDTAVKFVSDVLLLALLALAAYLTPIVKKFIEAKVAEIKASLTPNEQQLLDFITPIAVDAVEGQKANGVIGKGEAAQKAATNYVQEYLNARGVKLPVSTIVARVEAEVARAWNAPKLAKPQ